MSKNVDLFLEINSLVGKNRWFDAFGRAGAEWVIIAMGGWFLASIYISKLEVLFPIIFSLLLWLIGIGISFIIGFLVKEFRPHIYHPESRVLFTPLSNWKSFPSDHSFSAWLVFFLALIFGLPGAWALLLLALWVSWGRVYAGLHYPLDIVGGVVLAGLLAILGYYILFHISGIPYFMSGQIII
ncbi:MAG: Bacitracin transport permease protein BCRC [Candidatus Magasanikbacteria bacterium GW2011_GWC2_34_16]|uniref:Bacitracin transport permease protein BCRC n=2 Tax=Candidatus Magasanikiibacteriota TaxID=1752731 RepID=A0A0G0HQ17_9BACT|nr:MAG: Bacitracin transport permease protein BCRC [Candidatus Magasanikbacteria bacterium GW2011_GWC2_34_16]KKQ40705.1 MAG: Bacitracin transport permease protein BCRC [Candidatus Magasanikbacteria bacterium GW2011_GWA2_37_8]